MEPFYRQLDAERFESTPATSGPWRSDAQHAGPPSALLARQMELHEPRDGMRLADVRTDILGPVPVAPLTVTVQTLRAGRSMELLEATASADDGRPALIARAWRILRAPDDFPRLAATGEGSPPDSPADTPARAGSPIPGATENGYGRSVEWRFVSGGMGEGGSSVVWGRQLNTLVDDEKPSSWQRVLVLADSGGGVTFSLDPARHRFINCDLHVALDRDLEGEWLRMDVASRASGGHGGIVHDVLSDERGRIGIGLQAMVAQDVG